MAADNDTIRGKTALVTGGAKRLGRAISLALARAGCNVIVHHNRSADEAEKLLGEIKALGVASWKTSCDLADLDSTARLVRETTEEAGHIDILVNNASVFPESRLERIGIDELHRTLDINAFAPLMLAREFAKQTVEGVIVNILDSRIRRIDLDHAGYQLSKNMLHTLTGMMAAAFAPGIRVNGVAPGMILPPPDRDEAYLSGISERTLTGGHGSPEDIAQAVLFLAGSPFTTGEVIYVDGGENTKRRTYDGM